MQQTSSTATSPSAWSQTRDAAIRLRAPVVAGTLAAATGTGLLVWALAAPVGGLDLGVATGSRIGPGAVVLATLTGGVAAWLLLMLLARRRRGLTRWTMLALLVLLLSLASPVLAGAVGGVLWVLELMHLLVGGVLILGLRRSAVPRVADGRTVSTEST